MSRRRTTLAGALALAALAAGLGSGPSLAQPAGCSATEASDPPRRVLRCRNGITINAEAATTFGLVGRPRTGDVQGARLTGKALLIDTAGGRGRGFQILTPHAVASVRGTRFAVDVEAARTSVFVREGVVAVRRRAERREVLLRSGEGVDVDAGRGPLEVKRWPAERVARLLARFGE